MEKVLLYAFTSDWIKITIDAYFDDKENLIIDGYDIGKRVKEVWGDSDYEYTTTIKPDDVVHLYALLNITNGNKKELLTYLQNHYNTNSCYSELQNFLDHHKIKYEGFSWR